jgi:hypothetical protein
MSDRKEVVRSRIDDVFDLVVYKISESDKCLEIDIEDRIVGGRVFCVNEFVASVIGIGSFVVASGPQFTSFPEFRIVEFLIEAMSDTKEIFGVLHEMGHVHEYLERFKNGKKETSDFDLDFHNFYRLSGLSSLSIERIAWAKAIKYARVIKRKFGLDLFKFFNNTDEFFGWVRRTGLRSYERSLEISGIRAYTKNRQVMKWLEREIREMKS